jgi:hypothetical protein
LIFSLGELDSVNLIFLHSRKRDGKNLCLVDAQERLADIPIAPLNVSVRRTEYLGIKREGETYT